MTYATSTFFAKFSLRELVGARSSGPTARPGGMFAGVGGGGCSGGPGLRNYHKSETCSCPIHTLGDDRFDEAEFTTALKEDVKRQITDSGAVITLQGDIAGNFNSSEFYFEYAQGEIQGRIVMSGKVIGGSYRLRADLEERT